MKIENVNINQIENRISVLAKRGIEDTIDVCYLPPRRYYHFEKKNELSADRDGKFSRIDGIITKVQKAMGKYSSYDTKICVATKKDPAPEDVLHITCHGKYMYDIHKENVGKRVTVCGNIAIFNGYYCMMDPLKFSVDIVGYSSDWDVILPKYSNIGVEWLKNLQSQCFIYERLMDTLPEYVRLQFDLPTRRDALHALARPKDKEGIQKGLKYRIIEDLMYFACMSEHLSLMRTKESPYVTKKDDKAKELVKLFPYKLTDDQEKVIENISRTMLLGDCANELVQGDVGCGKSIVAFYMMTLIAENGYQAVLMAPTTILSTQHYNDYKEYAEKLGLNVAFLGGTQKASEKKKILQGIKDGSVNVIIGTHAVLSEAVEYNNLALVCIDEEHRFGVKQRETLLERTLDGVHTISFSATPIPRTLATSLFNDKTIHEIKTVPAGRKPIKTAIVSDDNEVFGFVNRKLYEGSQVYVVCPLIDTSDNDLELRTVKETAALYEKTLRCTVGVITGAESKASNEKVLDEFKDGKIKVLVATTVVEVGVNVPNATVMVIEDAFMFGLSQLHQLRGRVGRGTEQGYCILRSDRDSERLNIMCRTTDGFEIAEEDMKLRGAGNLIGTEQSGNNHYFQLAINYPNFYKKAKVLAKTMVENGEDDYLIDEIERRNDKMHVNPSKIKFFDTAM